jgi:hypothetical protein
MLLNPGRIAVNNVEIEAMDEDVFPNRWRNTIPGKD